MINVAQDRNADKVEFSWGRVARKQDRKFVVDTDFGRITVEKSDGCLVAPGPGDLVLVAWDRDLAFILNVVKQASPQAAVPIDLEGNLDLTVAGDVNLRARRIRMDGAEEVEVQTGRLGLFFASGKSVFRSFRYKGESILGWTDVLKTVARQVDVTAERVMERVVRHYRRIRDFEDSRVGRLNLAVTGLFSVKSKSTTIKARENVKVDGDRIMLG